jgi:hypothetical protein
VVAVVQQILVFKLVETVVLVVALLVEPLLPLEVLLLFHKEIMVEALMVLEIKQAEVEVLALQEAAPLHYLPQAQAEMVQVHL